VLSEGQDVGFSGNYLYLEREEGGHIWVNPATVAYVEDGPN